MDERVILAIGAILFSFSFSFSVRYDPMLVKLLAQNINKRYAQVGVWLTVPLAKNVWY